MSALGLPSYQASQKTLFFLMVLSVLMVMSIFASFLAPLPLVFAVVIFGRLKGWLASLSGLLLLGGVASLGFTAHPYWLFYLAGLPFVLAVSEIIKSGTHPAKGMLAWGAGLYIFLLVLWGALLFNAPVTSFFENIFKTLSAEVLLKKDLILAQGGQEAWSILTLFSDYKLLTQRVLAEIPSVLFIGLFFILWFYLTLMAKWQRLFSIGNSYHERNLFSFKLPEFFIWLVMSSMLLVAFGEEISKELSLRGVEVYGLNILRIVGCLYFFQGMGIYQNFLDVLKIRGILRTLLVLLTVFSLPMVVAFIGFIDVWVQFERFFKITKKDDKKL